MKREELAKLLSEVLDAKWKWVAKDSYGTATVFIKKPIQRVFQGWKHWDSDNLNCVLTGLDKKLFDCLSVNEPLKIPREPNWNTVEVDTPIFVRDVLEWGPAYFAKYKGGKVYAWKYGTTSFTAESNEETVSWIYAKLAKEE